MKEMKVIGMGNANYWRKFEIVMNRERCLLAQYGYFHRRSDMFSELISKAQCTVEDKKEMLKTIAVFITLSEMVRRYGLLALERVENKLPCDFMRIGANLVLEGHDPQLIELILKNIIYSENPSGKELLERLIIIEGILAVQGADNPHVVKTKLLSYLGEKYVVDVYDSDSKVNCLLRKYAALNNFVADNATAESSVIWLPDLAKTFSTVINSSIVMNNMAGIFALTRKNIDNSETAIYDLNRNIYAFIDDVLMPEVRNMRALNMRMDQAEILMKKLQGMYAGRYCWERALSETLAGKFLGKQDDERYTADIFINSVREFFKIIIAVISEKEQSDRYSQETQYEVIRHCIVAGKPALEFPLSESQKCLVKGLEVVNDVD